MTREDILDKAKECVCGQREQDYGSPENNFQLIADLWSVYLGIDISPVDVAMMMVHLKTARVKTGGGTIDSLVDIAGYSACAGEIISMSDTSVRINGEPLYFVKGDKEDD